MSATGDLMQLLRWLASEVSLTEGQPESHADWRIEKRSTGRWFAHAAEGWEGEQFTELDGCPHPDLLREVLGRMEGQ